MTKQQTYCIYCGTAKPDSVDHIPPSCLFPSPKPSNLLTVPCCLTCNNGASQDDEYFKSWLVMRWDISLHPIGSKLIDSVHRALIKPQKRGLLNLLRKSMKPVKVVSPSGIYLGNTQSYEVDLIRLGRVTSRIVQGLFFKETGDRIPSNYEIVSYAESGLRSVQTTLKTSTLNALQQLMAKPSKTIGEGVFEYRYHITPEDSYISIWILRFFESESFICFTFPKIDSGFAS